MCAFERLPASAGGHLEFRASGRGRLQAFCSVLGKARGVFISSSLKEETLQTCDKIPLFRQLHLLTTELLISF